MRAHALAAGIALCLAAAAPLACGSRAAATSSSTSTGAGGSGGAGGMPMVPPAPAVNEQKTHPSPITDDAYQAKVVTQFRTVATLPDLDVRSLATLGGTVYAGTASGLASWQAGDAAFAAVAVTGAGAVVDLAVLGGAQLVVGRVDGVEVLTAQGGPGAVWPVAGESISAVATHGADVYVGTENGLSLLAAAGQTPIMAAQGFAIRDLAVLGEVMWMATAAGVSRYDLVADALLPDLVAPALLADDDVRAVTVSGDGQAVLAASATGLARISADGTAATLVVPGVGGLPNGDLRAVADAGGETLTGHGIGATAQTAAGDEHYHSLRWIPGEEVTAVALGPDRSRWIATHAGVARVAFAAGQLADKAALFEPMVQQHWRMGGFVDDQVSFADAYDLTTAPQVSDSDNDGLWTEMQIAAWCFAYASTGDEAYYQNARRAMDTVFLLFDVPGETFAAHGLRRGYISRSLVRDDEGALFTSKAGDSRWQEQSFEHHTYYWKNDTSSDEYAGHYFGIPIFYDLCAKTEPERQELRDRIALAASYVIDGGDKLIGLDGQPTTFGRWDNLAVAVDGDLGACLAAGKPNCVDSYGGGGWLNSIEILGQLLAAWHLTGDPKYYDEYERLAITERYGDMIPLTSHTFTVTDPHQANFSDHELASLAYFTLLRYEPNPDRRAKWVKSLLDFFGYEQPARELLENAVIAGATADGADLAGATRTFREWPVDWRQWLVDNTHRVDATLDVTDRFGDAQFKTVLPYDEIRTMEWNGNPHAVVGGGDGTSVQGPWPWLLPYWMMRYFGAIAKAP